jgi:hypothetical protein
MFRRFLLTAVTALGSAIAVPSVSRADFLISVSSNNGDLLSLEISNNSSNYGTIVSASGTGGFLHASPVLVGQNAAYAAYSSGNSSFIIQTLLPPGANPQQSLTIDSISFDKYNIQTSATTSNQPGSVQGATLQLQNTNVTSSVLGNASNASTNSITVSVSEDGFTTPALGGSFLQGDLSSSAGQLGNGSGVTISGQSFYSNNLLGTPTQSIGTSLTTTGSDVASSSPFTSVSGYTLGASITVTGLTYQAGQLGNTDLTTTLYAPAPSGLIFAATMLPFLGLLRRRLKVIATEAQEIA